MRVGDGDKQAMDGSLVGVIGVGFCVRGWGLGAMVGVVNMSGWMMRLVKKGGGRIREARDCLGLEILGGGDDILSLYIYVKNKEERNARRCWRIRV